MRKFISDILFLLLPLFLWAVLILLVDPFNYFNISPLINNEVKNANALSVNPLLWRTIELNRSPSDYLLIGDSRTDALPVDEIFKISGRSYQRIVTNAIKMNEIFELFWMINEKKKIKSIIIGINFNMFNDYGFEDRVNLLKSLLNNPLRYIFNKNIAEATFYVLRGALFNKNISSRPDMTKEEFWEWNIRVKATHWYGKYKFPEKLYSSLNEIDKYAFDNQIEIIFINVPHYIDFHKRLREFQLTEEELKFKKIISGLHSKVIDYDFENEITLNKNNFNDPIHYKKEIGKLIVNEIWSNNFKIGRILNK